MKRFEGKVAVITGAASGIGLGTLERLVEEGAQALACDIQDEKGAALEARFGGRVRYQHCDVRDEAQIGAAMAAAVDAFGGIDVVFNNAGAMGAGGPLEELCAQDFRDTLDLLLGSVVAGTIAAIPHLKARGGGAIINTASVAALQAGFGPSPYSTAKAAVLHFSRCAAAELAQYAIRVNAICPGMIATSIFGDAMGMARPVADQMAAMLAQRAAAIQPIKRAGLPEDIAAMVALLGSDDGKFITGAHFLVDGGLTVGPRTAWDATAENPFMTALGVDQEQAQALREAMRARRAK